MNLFLTGTDTGVGKTFVAALLVRALRQRGFDAVGMKPICCGDRDDAEQLWDASDRSLSLNEVNPVWLRTPAAPYAAAMVENRPIDLALVDDMYRTLSARHGVVIVEGVGGWAVPIASDFFVSDLAAGMGAPVAVVVANRLGALNHTILTVQAIRRGGLACAGLVLNDVGETSSAGSVATATNASVLEAVLGEKILWEIGAGQHELVLNEYAMKLFVAEHR